MTLQSSGQISATDIIVEDRKLLAAGFDMDVANYRSLANKKTANTEIKFSDFYGKSYEKDFYFSTYSSNYCTHPIIGHISDYVNVLPSETFQLIIAFQGSWAPINGTYPAIEVFCRNGVASSYDIGSTTGGKSAHMTFSYDGGDTFTIGGYYTGSSTSFPCADVYILGLIYPEPQNRSSGYNVTGVYWATYMASRPANTSFIEHYTPPPPPPDNPPPPPWSCFMVDSPVIMADGSVKMIQDIQIGEFVRGAYGESNPVLALDRPLLGNRSIYVINDEHRTTDEHPHLRPDNTFFLINKAGWLANENNSWQPVITDAGITELWNMPGTDDTDMLQPFEIGEKVITSTGERTVETITEQQHPADTQLYNLVLGGSHTYFVEGYCVTGFINNKDFDYTTWTAKGQPWTADDYRKSQQ